MRIVLMGPPGVGKGTQAVRLRDRLGVPHISTGDMLRDAVDRASPVGRKVRSFVDSGQLVPDELMGELIGERLAAPDAVEGFILDGFPRTVEQVEILDRTLSGLGVALDRAVILTAPEDEIVRRLSGRRVCPKCRAVYHLENRPPKSAGVCDGCGSALVQRADDAEPVVRRRLGVYREQTLPVAAAYRDRELLAEVDGGGQTDVVFARLEAALGEA